MIYFTSDTHFGHKNIIKYCNRPFNSVEQMNEEMIRRWNNIVQPNDEVYHLGDFSMGRGSIPKIWLPKLNGKIHLIRGNHDPNVEGFHSVQDYLELKYNKKYYILFHYPIMSWNRMHNGARHLFGHVHGALTKINGRKTIEDRLSMDVGSDCCDFRPISIEEVEEIMSEHSKFLKEKMGSKVGAGAVSD